MPIHEVVTELNRLRSEGLISDYAIGGAVAAHAYIEPAATEDVDVFVVVGGDEGASLDPLTRVSANLIAHGAKWNGPYLVIGDWPVQFLLPGTRLYGDAIANARTQDFGTRTLGRVMGPEHLAAIALDTGRDKDYPRVAELIERGKVDVPALMAMIERFGLTERWKTFRTRFPADND